MIRFVFPIFMLACNPAHAAWNPTAAYSGTNGFSSWLNETGCGIRNNEQECYTDGDNLSYDQDGNLVITGQKEGETYTSGSVYLLTATNFRVEAKIMTGEGQGVWPAFWLGGTVNDANTLYGEVDMMEVLGDEPEKIYSSFHVRQGSSAANYIYQTTTTLAKLPNDWVVYAAEMTPDECKLYVDGTLVKYINRNTATPVGTLPLQQPWRLIINQALGGDWPGPVSDAALPVEMKVAYVKIWEGNGFVDRPSQAAFKGNPNQMLH